MPYYLFTAGIWPVKPSWRNRRAFRQLCQDMASVGTDVQCARENGQVTISLKCEDIALTQWLFERGWPRFKGVKHIYADMVQEQTGGATPPE